MRLPKRILWFRFRDDRRRTWKVWWTVPETSNEDLGEHDWGQALFDTKTILINARTPRAILAATVLHEMLHAAFADTAIAMNETAIDTMAVRSVPVLRQFGFRLPPPPPNYWGRARKMK